MPGYRLSAWLRPLLTLVALAGVLSLAACGGGNGAPNNPYQPGAGPLSVTPAVASAYSGNPITLTVTGGTAPYFVSSSDQSILPVPYNLSGNTLTVVPASVGAPTSVTLTINDSGGHAATAALTVNPALLLPNSVTITGNPNCASSGGDLCSGQDGTASVLVTGPTGGPLSGRQVRFDVVQGAFAIVSTAPGSPVLSLVSSLTVTSDQNGLAVVGLQVPPNATTQIATIRATDVLTGNSITSNFTIVAFSDGAAVLSVSPTDVSVPGLPASTPQCAINIPVTYYVYGGTPPYTVAADKPTLVTISGTPVQVSGGGFTVRATNCVAETLTITDASGRFVNATFASVLGPTAPSGGGGGSADCSSFSPPAAGCPIGPSLALTACPTASGYTASGTITGGTTPYSLGVDQPSAVQASVTSSTLTVTRLSPSSVTTPVHITITSAGVSSILAVPVSPANCP